MIELTGIIPVVIFGVIGWLYLPEAYADTYAEAIGLVGLFCVAAGFLVPAALLLSTGVQASGAGIALVLAGMSIVSLAVGWYMPEPDRSRIRQ